MMSPQTATLDVTGIVFGLGLVLSFGYWCTDFVLIQRALTARNMRESIQTPLIAGVFKLLFPALLVIPGLAAAVFFRETGVTRYDQALPFLAQHYWRSGAVGSRHFRRSCQPDVGTGREHQRSLCALDA